MAEMRFTKEHEWIRLESDGTATVGITDFAQSQLGDLVFVEVPAVGKALAQGDEAAVIESVKAVSEIRMPVGGSIVANNAKLVEDPALANKDPMGEGWFFRMKPSDLAVLEALMDQTAYQKFVDNQPH
jgi:glycine cleavage system H protein